MRHVDIAIRALGGVCRQAIMQQLVYPTMNRMPLKRAPPDAHMSAMVVEEGLPCLTQLAIWSALLLGVAGTVLGAAGLASSQQNKGILEEYVYSPPAAPPSSLLGADHCLDAVFGDLKAREVLLWPPAPAGGAASGVSWVSPDVYVVKGGQTTAQAQRVGNQGVGNLLQLLKGINTFLPSFTPSAVLSGEVTAIYTPSPVSAPPSNAGLMPFSVGYTQPDANVGAVTIAARLYLAATTTTAIAPKMINFKVTEQLPSLLGVRKFESYQSDSKTPQVNLYLEFDISYTSLDGSSGEHMQIKSHFPYSIRLSGRRLPNGKVLHGVKLQPQPGAEDLLVSVGSNGTYAVEARLLSDNLPTFYWELEEDARCGLVG